MALMNQIFRILQKLLCGGNQQGHQQQQQQHQQQQQSNFNLSPFANMSNVSLTSPSNNMSGDMFNNGTSDGGSQFGQAFGVDGFDFSDLGLSFTGPPLAGGSSLDVTGFNPFALAQAADG